MQTDWWKESVVYQIYPRSFADANGDGIGDLQGVIGRLDYLSELGVDVVWLSPVYKSPNDDNGYDISDYHEIMDEFGTMQDWQELLAGMHARGIKLVMDLVVNHTSDEHAWFQAARSSKDSPYRDYYIWRPARIAQAGGAAQEPNNWASFFGGSAWEYDEPSGEYYLHLFSKKQPDLNWENPKLRQEVYTMMRRWLDLGVDGFRMDVINMISKVPGLPDATPQGDGPYHFGGEHFVNGPRLEEFLSEMKAEVLSAYDIMTVGETPMITTEKAAALTNAETGSLSMVFQFEHMDIDEDPATALPRRSIREWRLPQLKEVMSRWQTALQERGWNSVYLCNHDMPRSVSRFGNDSRFRVESAKMLATLVHLIGGTPYIYQGEEIGMTNVAFPTIQSYRDIETRTIYHEFVEEQGRSPEEALRIIHAKSRDNARTPMQWSAKPNAGFTTGEPWIPVNPNYTHINAAAAAGDPNSVLAYYKELIKLRRQYPIISHGRYELLLANHEQLYCFLRSMPGEGVDSGADSGADTRPGSERLLVVLNFSALTPVFAFPHELPLAEHKLLISNYPVDPAEDIEQLTMRPYEARAYLLSSG